MKKYLSGFLAICLAIGFSAFTPTTKKPAKKLINLYWFNVPGSINNGTPLSNPNVAYLMAYQPNDPSPNNCSGSTKYCHVGFTEDQVTVSGASVTLNTGQTPASFNSKQ